MSRDIPGTKCIFLMTPSSMGAVINVSALLFSLRGTGMAFERQGCFRIWVGALNSSIVRFQEGQGVVNPLPLLLARHLCYSTATFVNPPVLSLICWRWQWVIVVIVVVVWAGWCLLNPVTWQ